MQDLERVVGRQLGQPDLVHEDHRLRVAPRLAEGCLGEHVLDSPVGALVGALIILEPQRLHSVQEIVLAADDLPIEGLADDAHGNRLGGPRLAANENGGLRVHRHENGEQVFLERRVDGDVPRELVQPLGPADDHFVHPLHGLGGVVCA